MIPLPALSADLDPIREALDAATHDQRINWMRGLGRGQQRALYDLAEGRSPLDLAHFHGAEGEIIRHYGQNSLPFFCVCVAGGCRATTTRRCHR